ncbi:MutS-related protein [Haloimpatiens sp. FM7315]|uniref:MutS-related protein n=1 Tax=Haloimpatiens sp. FM7315 TaxID=3298609 RepID=UPI00370B4951
MLDRSKEYNNKVELYSRKIENKDKSIKVIRYFRLITFIIGIGVPLANIFAKNYLMSAVIFAFSLSIFIYLIYIHHKEIYERRYLISLKQINEKSIKRLNGKWKEFRDNGSEFKDLQHNYSEDLDIFGKSSVFQWINSTKTFVGRQKLRERLENPLKSVSEITTTQEAIKELSENLEWRQKLEAEGMVITNEPIQPEQLYSWGKDKNELYTNKWLIFFARLLPVLMLFLILMASFTTLISYKIPFLLFLFHMIILMIGIKERNSEFERIYKFKKSIYLYVKMLELIIHKDFESEYLKKLKKDLIGYKGYDAKDAIKKLSSIYEKIANRANAIVMVFNIMFLLDYQFMIEFGKWRVKWGNDLEKWFNSVGEFEALSSISNINYDNPNWAFPNISKSEFKLKTTKMGHPLIGDNMVCNSINIEQKRNILLITGSNMSGKSTFLRTIGTNLVLAYIGSPVCAEDFRCSLMNIITCMRTSDNLENNISSFYAEILRIKKVVENAKINDNVFFLLDELFKGTNSIDRHRGAIALIKQLGRNGASGLISTHDLELCSLEEEYSKVKNYHFMEYYEDNKLKFDYKIREGASKTRNAMYLIKMIGIDVD